MRKTLGCFLQGQGHKEGLYNITVFCTNYFVTKHSFSMLAGDLISDFVLIH